VERNNDFPYHRYFQEAVLDLVNCINVAIANSTFKDNLGTGISFEPSRGNTGAVAFGFRDPPLEYRDMNVTFEVRHTVFINNSALATAMIPADTTGREAASRAVSEGRYPGRGGALGLFLSETLDNVSITVTHCEFRKNFARAYGGALFFIVTEVNSLNILHVHYTLFHSNSGGLGAPGVQLSYLAGRAVSPISVTLTNCVFMNHTARSGGALSVFPSFFGGGGGIFRVIDCAFIENHENTSDPFAYGAAIGVSEINIFQDRSSVPVHDIINW